MQRSFLLFLSFLFFVIHISIAGAQGNYYVSLTGSDDTGTGTNANPWATISYALDNVNDGSLILVKPGTYFGRIRMRGTFNMGVAVKSEVPYLAKLRNDDRVMTFYTHESGCSGITIEDFDIAHDGPGAAPLVVHIDGNGNGDVHDITIRNCILHDSYDNDILKINNSCYNITVQGNLFFNQTGSDEHIDGNSTRNLIIEDNIFMNDFASSGRPNLNNTSSFIVIKDSSPIDMYTGSGNVRIRRNIFLNYEGSTGHNFVLLGEDGMPYYEAFDVIIENNLMLGNSAHTMRVPFGVKGCKNVIFRHNTVVGDFPSLAFAFRLNVEGNNLNNDSIFLYNNIWSDPTGTMEDFSDTPIGETDYFELDNNIYWNAGIIIPSNPAGDLVNINDDINSITFDPVLPDQSGIIAPYFNSTKNSFADGSNNIRAAFEGLVNNFARQAEGSSAIDAANPSYASLEDILANPRGNNPDIGALELDPVTSFHENSLFTSFQLWPNPVNDKLNISFEMMAPGTVSLDLYSGNGVLEYSSIHTQSHTSFSMQLEMSICSPGPYLLRVTDSAGKEIWKRILKK